LAAFQKLECNWHTRQNSSGIRVIDANIFDQPQFLNIIWKKSKLGEKRTTTSLRAPGVWQNPCYTSHSETKWAIWKPLDKYTPLLNVFCSLAVFSYVDNKKSCACKYFRASAAWNLISYVTLTLTLAILRFQIYCTYRSSIILHRFCFVFCCWERERNHDTRMLKTHSFVYPSKIWILISTNTQCSWCKTISVQIWKKHLHTFWYIPQHS
jgi:hypothetical protein